MKKRNKEGKKGRERESKQKFQTLCETFTASGALEVG